MSTVKLTLSLERSVVDKAKRIARRDRTSVSRILSEYVQGIPEDEDWRKHLTPRTQQAIGLIRNLPNRPYRELLEEALLEKYGLDK